MPPPSKPGTCPAFGRWSLHEGALHVNHIPLYLDLARAARSKHAHRPCGARQRAMAAVVPAGGGGVPWPAGLCVALVVPVQGPGWQAGAHLELRRRACPWHAERLRRSRAPARRADADRTARGPPPRPWRIDDAPPDYIDKLLRAIVGIELAVERWEGLWKMSQNRIDTDRAGVVQGLRAEGTPAAADMAALVRGGAMP